MKPNARLVLSDGQSKKCDLLFEIHPKAVARRWAESLVYAGRQSRIRERNRLYNFPHPELSSEDRIVNSISKSVARINQVFPGLIPFAIDRERSQETINQIHTFFADTAHSSAYSAPELNDVWNDLNNSLHAYESLLRSRQNEAAGSDPSTNVVITWEDPIYQPFEDDDYQHFTVAKQFGTCYINYCQIGRHLFEIFQAGDQVANDEHILPLRRMSADTYVWLGSTTGPKALAKRRADIEQWFIANEARLNGLGFFWGDPKLAIGWIPVATLVGDFSDFSKRQEFRASLSGVDRVEAFLIDP